MESTEKKISIHPDLMFMTSGKTKKNKASKEKKEQIKMKTQPKTKNNTLRKQSLLRMIRKHQDEKHRDQLKMMSGNVNITTEKPYNNNMDDTLQFMNNIKEKHSVNHTLKNNNYNTLSISQPSHTITLDNDNTNNIISSGTNTQSNIFDLSNEEKENTDVIIQDDSVKFHVNVPQKWMYERRNFTYIQGT